MKSKEIFIAKLVDIGSEARSFLTENMIILFNQTAPEELYKHCFIIKIDKFVDKLKIGDLMKIGNEDFEIVFVGEEANKNLRELGHITLFFNQDFTNALPGSIFVSNENKPYLEIGEKISINRRG